MSTKISIIIPVYKTEKYLRECLDSVLSQTLKDIEVICINDGSPDNSISILKEYENADSRVTIIDKKNEGVGKARNDGIRIATGEFIAFMDSDDYYPDNGVLEFLYDNAIKFNVNISGGTRRNFENSKLTDIIPDGFYGTVYQLYGRIDYSQFQYDYGYTKYIFKRSIIKNNNITFPSLGRFQDPPFMVRAADASESIFIDERPSYVYRQIRTNSKISLSKTVDMFEGIAMNLDYSRNHNLAKLHYLTYMRLNIEGSYMVINNLDSKDAEKLLAASLRAFFKVDFEFLKDNGYITDEYPLPESIKYLLNVNSKYEKIKDNAFVKLIRRLKGNEK